LQADLVFGVGGGGIDAAGFALALKCFEWRRVGIGRSNQLLHRLARRRRLSIARALVMLAVASVHV
jgi:hypothetical protein